MQDEFACAWLERDLDKVITASYLVGCCGPHGLAVGPMAHLCQTEGSPQLSSNGGPGHSCLALPATAPLDHVLVPGSASSHHTGDEEFPQQHLLGGEGPVIPAEHVHPPYVGGMKAKFDIETTKAISYGSKFLNSI